MVIDDEDVDDDDVDVIHYVVSESVVLMSSSMDIDDEDVHVDDDDVIHSVVSEDVVLVSSSMGNDDEDDKSLSISTSVQPPITMTVETSWISVHIPPV